jgi:hypothetical protein
MNQVWIFNGPGNQFPSAAFTQRENAEAWIQQHHLTGTLTAYPLDVAVYDWAIRQDFFTPRRENQSSPEFIARFSSASQEHYHYKAGLRVS